MEQQNLLPLSAWKKQKCNIAGTIYFLDLDGSIEPFRTGKRAISTFSTSFHACVFVFVVSVGARLIYTFYEHSQ